MNNNLKWYEWAGLGFAMGSFITTIIFSGNTVIIVSIGALYIMLGILYIRLRDGRKEKGKQSILGNFSLPSSLNLGFSMKSKANEKTKSKKEIKKQKQMDEKREKAISLLVGNNDEVDYL